MWMDGLDRRFHDATPRTPCTTQDNTLAPENTQYDALWKLPLARDPNKERQETGSSHLLLAINVVLKERLY